MPRRLRIAVSVFFALMAVAFAVLWVRSYWRFDGTHPKIGNGRELSLYSVYGSLFVAVEPINLVSEIRKYEGGPIPKLLMPEKDAPQFEIRNEPNFFQVQFPHWLPVVVATTAATLIWLPWSSHFSLRALLIAATLIAVVLGLAVWLAR